MTVSLCIPLSLPHCQHSLTRHSINSNSTFLRCTSWRTVQFSHSPRFPAAAQRASDSPENTQVKQWPPPPPPHILPKLGQSQLRLSVTAILFLGLCSAATAAASPPPVVSVESQNVEDCHYQENNDNGNVEKFEDEKLQAAFEAWQSKTYALTVPLRIITLRGSIPPSWVKDFIQSQGRRVRLRTEFQATLEDIFSGLSVPLSKGNVGPKSTMAADLVSIGDSWLNYAIKMGMVEPMKEVENYDWFKSLSNKWKVYLRRNCQGELDCQGEIWAAPYRWGTMVIAYKNSKFRKHKLAPIEDWADLWRPELAGRISMIDSPREVVGAVLKYMGASYNTENIDLQVSGGRSAVEQNLALLGKQVRLFDSMHYLKAFGAGDVWVAVGWSSDIIPVAKRMSNVTVIVPKSGASLWADLWAIPAASKFRTNQIGGRVRGPSPVVHQWIEFCLQAARSLPFKREVIPGASPSALKNGLVQVSRELSDGKPKLDSNLIAGIPPPEILARCEFLEPLSDATLSDYQWLIATLQKPDRGLIDRIQRNVSSIVQSFKQILHSKAT